MDYLTVRFIFCQLYCQVEIFGKYIEIKIYIGNW
jgi:hypothetical protein